MELQVAHVVFAGAPGSARENAAGEGNRARRIFAEDINEALHLGLLAQPFIRQGMAQESVRVRARLVGLRA